MKVTIYAEGAGDPSLNREFRIAFQSLMYRAGFKGRMPGCVPCGSRNDACDKFLTAMTQKTDDEVLLLLVDSEDPPHDVAWKHLKQRDGWQLDEEHADLCFMMVVVMETWFLADPEALAEYFGKKFNPDKLPANPELEKVPKPQVYSSLKAASKDTKKGDYSKGKHSFDLLGLIDPKKIESRCLSFKALIERLDAIL